MKKYLKLFFSRFSLVALTILLMFAASVVAVLALAYFAEHGLIRLFPGAEREVRFAFDFLRWLLVTSTVVHIVNRDMIPETKIPWILCVAVLNLFGVAIYAVFSNNRPTRRQHRSFALLNEQSRKFLEADPKTLPSFHGWESMSTALLNSTRGAVVYGGTECDYFATGEAFFERFLLDLSSAKEFIFLEYFILARGKMWYQTLDVLKEKVKEGVEVRLIYDDIGCMGKIRAGYYKELRKYGIKCVKFNPFVPIVSNLHNNRDHRKIAVIDGKIGYTGGINLADEYINEIHPFGRWKDTAVRLEGSGVRGLSLLFLRMYNLSSKEIEDFSPYMKDYSLPAKGYVQPYGAGPRPVYDRRVAEDVYINILNEAKRYVYITTPYLIIDFRMREAILSAAARGVDVRLVLPHIPDKKIAFALSRSNYMALLKGGVKIYEYTPGFIHAKSFLADDLTAVVGTVNLDYRSLLHHYENAVVLYDTKANSELLEDFQNTFKECSLLSEEDAKKNVVFRGICEIAKIFAPLF